MSKQQFKELILTIVTGFGILIGINVAIAKVYGINILLLIPYILISVLVTLLLTAIIKFIFKE